MNVALMMASFNGLSAFSLIASMASFSGPSFSGLSAFTLIASPPCGQVLLSKKLDPTEWELTPQSSEPSSLS